jgi:four helix bundle protein
MAGKSYVPLKDLEVYQLSRKLSAMAWKIYDRMNYEEKRTMDDQFIRSVDPVGANIAEGYNRFHYLDKIRFYYYSRASLAEAIEHWLERMYEREKVSKEYFDQMKEHHHKL